MRNSLEFERQSLTFYMPGKKHAERRDFISLRQLKASKDKLALRIAIAWACKTYNKILNVE